MKKRILKIYKASILVFATLTFCGTGRLMLDLYEPGENLSVRCIGYLILTYLSIILYKMSKKDLEK